MLIALVKMSLAFLQNNSVKIAVNYKHFILMMLNNDNETNALFASKTFDESIRTNIVKLAILICNQIICLIINLIIIIIIIKMFNYLLTKNVDPEKNNVIPENQ